MAENKAAGTNAGKGALLNPAPHQITSTAPPLVGLASQTVNTARNAAGAGEGHSPLPDWKSHILKGPQTKHHLLRNQRGSHL